MSVWESYPATYREREVQAVLRAARAGDSVSVVGLSGAGKSNLLGFLANRANDAGASVRLAAVDCNRLQAPTPEAFYRLVRAALGERGPAQDESEALYVLLEGQLDSEMGICLLLDRFDILLEPPQEMLYNNLRAMRDAFKYRLSYVFSTRRPLPNESELAELAAGHVIWLGTLSEADARWSANQYAERVGTAWHEEQLQTLLALSGGYPSLLRAACEAAADRAELTLKALLQHPAVAARLKEFWDDQPSDEALEKSGLAGIPLLDVSRPVKISSGQLTAKEQLLLEHLQAHAGSVCSKDDLIRAVWPEDKVFIEGVRDDSLAQLVRRLRSKIEPDPNSPRFVLTVTGRGYTYRAGGA